MKDTKERSPGAAAPRPENTTVVSEPGGTMSRENSTKVSPDLLQRQRVKIAAMDAGTDRLLAEIYKSCLVHVTDALKSYANALHKDRHHPLPFVMCQEDECICGRNVIDSSIKVIAKKVEPKPEEEKEEEYDGDPDQLAHDPDLPPPSEVFK